MRDWIENEWLIPALSYGMSMDEFWRHTPRTITLWFKGLELREKNEHNIRDAENWQLGAYMLQAVASTLSKGVKYPKKPQHQVEVLRQDRLSEEYIQKERLRAAVYFKNWAEAVNRKFKKK